MMQRHKYIKLYAVDTCYNNTALFVNKRKENHNFDVLMHFFKFMHDLGIQVINGRSMTDFGSPQQEIAFRLFQHKMGRLKNPKAYLEVNFYSNIKPYREELEAGIQESPHVMLTIDLDAWTYEEDKLSKVKAALSVGTVHVSLEKFASQEQQVAVYFDHMLDFICAESETKQKEEPHADP